MLWQKRDFHLHFRELCAQQLLSEAGVAEQLCVSGWASLLRQIYCACSAVGHFKPLFFFFFFNFLENHLTANVKKRGF